MSHQQARVKGQPEATLRHNANVLNMAMQGKLNNTGSFTLSTGTAVTVVTDSRIGNKSVVVWTPTHNIGMGDTGMYVSNFDPANNQFSLTHANSSTGGRTFNYAIFG